MNTFTINFGKINIIYDGQIHRFYVNGDKPHSKNGWYLAKPNGWMVYSTWKKNGEKHYINKEGRHLNSAQTNIFKKQLSIEQHIRIIKQEDNSKNLENILSKSKKETHCYLIKKGFPNMKFLVYKNILLVPIYDFSPNFKKLISLQYIYEDGKKKFASGCRIKGGLHFILNAKAKIDNEVYLCEGLSTGLTIAKASNRLTIICFSVSNIIQACELLNNRFPEYKITICADNDRNTEGNPGVFEATKAAKKYKLNICIPNLSKCNMLATDFNDVMVQTSLIEVKEQLMKNKRVIK